VAAVPNSPNETRGAGIAAVFLALAGFSWGFTLAKLIGLPAPVIAFWRLLIGAGTLALAGVALRTPWPRSRFVVLAGLAFGVHQLLYITATQTTSIAVVALIGATQPLLIAAVSHRTVGEHVPRALFACSLLALVGVGFVVHANLDASSRTLRGDLLAVANLFMVTIYFLAAKRARLDGAATVTLTAAILGIAFVVVTPFALYAGVVAPAGSQWAFLLLLALASGNCHLLLNWAHRRVTAALAALILAGLPVLAGVWAHLVLDEPLDWRHVVGMAVVVGAIELGRRADRGTSG
jgi:probable blue pigment (indigoidine) exporter